MSTRQTAKNLKSPPHRGLSLDHRKLLVAKHFAKKRYGNYRHVIGLGLGTKFKRPSRSSKSSTKVPATTCIQFFVRHKPKSLPARHRLPKFLYGRTLDGRIDYRQKIPTDVIKVGALHAACNAGARLDANTEHGLITLIFKNKADPARPFFLLSCAHVAGDIGRSPPPYDELTSDCSAAQPFANTLVTSTANHGEVDYDIALARISDLALPLEELTIRDHALTLSGFLPAQYLQQGLWVDAALRNVSPRGSVDALHVTASVQYGSKTLDVHNLFGVNVHAQKGDSGGLVYQNAQAVGIVVAMSPEGWLWFQPLEWAFKYLQGISPIQINLFDNQPV